MSSPSISRFTSFFVPLDTNSPYVNMRWLGNWAESYFDLFQTHHFVVNHDETGGFRLSLNSSKLLSVDMIARKDDEKPTKKAIAGKMISWLFILPPIVMLIAKIVFRQFNSIEAIKKSPTEYFRYCDVRKNLWVISFNIAQWRKTASREELLASNPLNA